MISSLNFYYAKPGNEAAVLRQRLHACEVRLELRIPRGRVFARTQGRSDLPDVVWEQVFDDVSGHHADMAVRAASPAFEEVRAGMRKLCRRFERPLFDIVADKGAMPASAAALISWDWIFCPAERIDEALAIVQRAAREPMRYPAAASRILRLASDGSDLPALLWQREYDSGGPDVVSQADLRAACEAVGARAEASLWVAH